MELVGGCLLAGRTHGNAGRRIDMGDVRAERDHPDRTFVGFEPPRSGESRTKVAYDGLATPEAVCAGHKVHGIRVPRRCARKYSIDHLDVMGGFARGLTQKESTNFLDVRRTDSNRRPRTVRLG